MKRRLGFWQAMTFLGYLAGAAVGVVLAVAAHLHIALCVVIGMAVGIAVNVFCWAKHHCPHCGHPLGLYRRYAFKKCPFCGQPLDDNM